MTTKAKVTQLFKSSATSATVYFIGDYSAQMLIEKKEKWDYVRTLKFSSIGFFWVGPYCSFALVKINQAASQWYYKVRKNFKSENFQNKISKFT